MADLRYKVVVDDAEARNKLRELLSNTGVGTADGGDGKATASINNASAATTKLKEAQLANIESIKRLREERSKEIGDLNVLKQIEQEAKALLAEKKIATEDLTRAQKQANVEYQQSRKALSDHALQLKKDAEERRKATEEERKAEKAVRDAERARKDAERAEAQRQKTLERNRAQLQKESSAYYQLNSALVNVRKESKDVLAEMFKLEGQGKKNTIAYKQLADQARGLVAQTQYLDRGIKKIDASLGLHHRTVGNYAGALDRLVPIIGNINSQLSAFGVSLDDLATKPGAVKELGTSFIAMGRGLLAFVLSPVGLLITALTGLFMLFQRNKQTVLEFDSNLRDVSKTTGIVGKDLRDFGKAIVGLSKSLQVVDPRKLLEYAMVAGQLGVKGTANILAFTEALAKLETASDITGEEGGADIARLLQLTDGGVENVKQFGDEIVNLGNNFAATESEILSNATRIAQSTGIYKLGRQNVLAYATATKSVGVEAELVGSSIGRTLGILEKSIRTGKGLATVLQLVGGTQAEVSKRFREDASGVLLDFISGLNRTGKSAADFNKALSEVGITAVRDQAVIGSLASNGYGVLVDAMDKARDANGAMTAEFDNGSAKLVNQIGRVGIAWNNLVLSIEDGQGAIGESVSEIAGYFAELIDYISESSKLLAETKEEAIARRDAARNAYDPNQPRINTGYNYQNQYSFGGEFMSKEQRKARGLSDYGDYYLRDARGVNTVENAARIAAEYEKTLAATVIQNKKYWEDIAKDTQEAIDALDVSEKGSELWNKLNATLADAQSNVEKYSFKTQAKNAKALERENEQNRRAIESQRALQLQIDQANEQASRNQLSRDDQEVESIRDKYAKIREEARKFEADPKNKGLRVDLGGLRRSENFEISEATTRQGTIKLVEQLNKQKAIYDEYNAYVEENGIESADRLYGKQAEIAKAYRENLDSEYFDLLGRQQLASTAGASAGKFTQAEEERLKFLQEMRDSAAEQEESRVRQRNAALLKQYETYAQKRAMLVKRSQRDIADLESRGEKDRATRAKQMLDEEQKQLFQDEIENSARFKKTMEDIDKSSKWLLSAAFKTGKETVFSMIDGMYDATPEQRKALKKLFGDFFDAGANEAELGNLESVATLVNGFDQLVSMAGQFDESMSSALKTIGQMVGQVSSIASSIGGMLGNTGKGLSSAGGIASIVGAVFSIAGSIIEISEAKTAKINAEQQKQDELRIKQIEAVTKSLEYQLSLIQEIYGTDRVKAFQKAITDAYASANKSISELPDSQILLTGDKNRDIRAAAFNQYGGDLNAMRERVEELKNTIRKTQWNPFQNSKNEKRGREVTYLESAIKYLESGGATEYKFAWRKIGDITQEEVNNIRKLIDEGKFDEVTSAQLQNVIEQWEIWKDAMNQMREELTGVSFRSLTDGIISLFEQGKTSVEDFTEFFEKQMQQAILKGFSRDAIEKQMQPWYELFAQYSEDGLTQDEITKLREQYLSIMGNAEKQWEDLKKVTGQDFSDSTSSSGVKSESIAQSITESTGSEIVGTFRAGYDIWKRQLNTMEVQSKTQISLLQVANDKLLVLNAINTNTANTVARLDTAVKHLQNIDKNLGGAYARN